MAQRPPVANKASQNAWNPVALSLRNLGIDMDDVYAASWFTYGTPAIGANVVAMVASGSASYTIQIQGDSVFQLARMAAHVYVTGAVATAITLPPILLQISDTSSGANLFDNALPLFNVAYCGAGLGPFDLPQDTYRYFAPNASVQLQFTNLDAANGYTLRLNLQGNKLFSK